MESLFREYGIYASQGQRYKPVDANVLLYYKEAKNGQILEEGITETGSMASFTAAGTAYANYGVPMIPFLYLLFDVRVPARRRSGLGVCRFAGQRIPDGRNGRAQHAAGRRACSTRTGIQPDPVRARSPLARFTIRRYAYELAVIIQDGIRRMYQEREDRFYYSRSITRITCSRRCRRARGIHEGILKGSINTGSDSGYAAAQLFGSGSMLNEALRAQQILAERYQIPTDVWSVTSYNELRQDGLKRSGGIACIRLRSRSVPYISAGMKDTQGPIIASSDYMKAVPDQPAPWIGTQADVAGHGRVRTQRESRASAAFL